MPIQIDPKRINIIKEIVGRRLCAARRGAGLSQDQARVAIGHKTVTQISLAEDGKRIPTLTDLVKLADLYCVPLDFIVGRIDDPIAEAEEQSQALVVRAVAGAIRGCLDTFTKATSEHVGVALSGAREDRVELQEAIKIAGDLKYAIERLRELNPEYDDLKGGSRLDTVAASMSDLGRRLSARIAREKASRAVIDTIMHYDQIEARIQQFTLEFQVPEGVELQ